nr:methylmalonyl-CoA mutase family protein [Flexivirga aerilata]
MPGDATQHPAIDGRGAVDWDIRSLVDDPQTTPEQVLAELEGGATSLWIRLGRTGIALEQLPQLLGEVLLDVAPVVLDCPEDPVGAARAYTELLTAADGPAPAGSSLGADPIGAGADPAQVAAEIADLAAAAGVFGLTADGTLLHDRGASDAQELAYAVACGVAYLRALTAAGRPLDEAVRLVEFRVAATDQQFATIAKLRALRLLWAKVLKESGTTGRAHVHAVTSRPMMTRHDPYVNMLRGTVAAFAAGAGGADAVTVLPFDAALGLPEAFGRRIARNVSSLLISESHVARVADPAAGAPAIEAFTHDLAAAAWAELAHIESAGGVAAALADGSIDERVAAVAAERRKQVATRKLAITGVSEFPQQRETLPDRRPRPAGSWDVAAYDADYEAMRETPAAAPVFLATLGPVAQHTARATFAANLFAAGGVEVRPVGATGSVDEVVSSYDGERVVCLAGTDAAYAETGPQVISALRAAGASYVIVAGKPGDLDVDDSCAMGVDAVAFLGRVRKELGS